MNFSLYRKCKTMMHNNFPLNKSLLHDVLDIFYLSIFLILHKKTANQLANFKLISMFFSNCFLNKKCPTKVSIDKYVISDSQSI